MRARQLAGLGFAAGLGIAGAWAQGSLTPPGAPGPTMRTLAQVEPRTPVTNAPFTISQPGSYYLVTNLVSTGHGIVIQASNVTLDLMGFSLTGDRGVSDSGILLAGASNAPLRDVVVRGGRVSGFCFGVMCICAQNCRLEGLAIASNLYHGVYLGSSSGGRCDGNTVRDCAIGGNGNYGVFLSGSLGTCNGNTVRDCAISGNSQQGVHLYGYSGACNGNTIADCAISGNADFGVYLHGISGACDGNTVAHCVVRENADFGIALHEADGNRIENNHVSGTTGAWTYGIYADTTGANLFLQNSCAGQSNNYIFSANDTYGPMVTDSGILAATNGAAGRSPWANFSR